MAPENDDMTLRLVGQMVDGVSKQIEALDRLNRSEFANVKSQIDPLQGLPLLVTGVIEHQKSLDSRVASVEAEQRDAAKITRAELSQDRASRFTFRHVNVPTMCMSCVGMLTALFSVAHH